MFSKGKERYKLTTRYCIKKKGMVPIALHSKMQKETNAFFDINNCILVPNGIDIKRFAKVNVNKKILLNTLGIVKNSFIVGHVGSFKKQKNHEFLIKVFSAVKNKQSNAHLVLIGVGVLEERIRDLVWELGLQNSVSFLGNREDIPELMSIMDVFLFPSLYEGFGNVLIEAQTVGIKCVASDNIPNDAFVTNLVTPVSLNDSIDEWSEATLDTKTPGSIRGDLNKYDINNIIRDLENIYLESYNH